ncbi:NAD(P)-binding protein [Polyplosphaeria fusca]|uniref:NAD(P)-binding protein n=1 Tax=Polyplosphaeria fusca TaxID=682080 RepID=A0A9P4UZR3_9PLEO|nr:NAD(P)-binding protein [Polyplosphaeria fusca]
MAGTAGKVLLTGANGFVAAHILAGLIERNYYIVGTVRSEKRSNEILTAHPSWKEYITFVYIPDMMAEGAYDEAFSVGPFDYIIHNASPLNFGATKFEEEIIDPAIKGTTGLLKAAHKKGGPTLKRFVLLGSAVAILNEEDDMSKPGAPYTEADWNPVTVQYALDHNSVVAAYNASKKLAEQSAWTYMTSHTPSFDLAVINPDIIIGPLLHHVPDAKSVNQTNTFVYNFLNGTFGDIEAIRFPFYHAVDVRDVARAHIEAMTRPAAANKRIILVSGVLSPQIIVNTIRKHFPKLADRVIEGHPEQLMPSGVDPTGWDTSRSKEVLGLEYISIEQSIVDTVGSLLELEGEWGDK